MSLLSAPFAGKAGAEAFWKAFLRMPSQKPQKGRHAVTDVTGAESWAGTDADLARAVSVTPGVFLWDRSVRRLVELSALWVRIPLGDRDGTDLCEEAIALLDEQACPRPHFVVDGENALTLLWRIESLRLPKGAAPEEHHGTWRKILESWRRAATKLSYLFEPLGALPLDVASADLHLTSFVPLPLPSNSELVRFSGELGLEPPVLHVATSDPTPIRIAEVSVPLRRFDARLFAALGIAAHGRRKEWLKSAVSLAALEPQAPGGRHPAAVKIACAARWDGLEYEGILATLRRWAATCTQDGAFPFRRRQGDELELIARWAATRLRPGGPNTPGSGANGGGGVAQVRHTTRDAVAAATLAYLADQGGTFTGTFKGLAQQVALWSAERGYPQPCPVRTLKRALSELETHSDLTHEVRRCGRTWETTFVLLHTSEGQRGKSTWVPDPHLSGSVSSSEGVAGAALPPQGGTGGDFATISVPPPIDSIGEDQDSRMEDASLAGDSPEIGRAQSSRPRQRRLAFSRERGRERESDSRSRSRKSSARLPSSTEQLPPIDRGILDALADIGTGLSDADHHALLEEARSELRVRPRVLKDFVGALRRRARRILRLRELAAASAEHALARQRARQRAAAMPPPDVETGADAWDVYRKLLFAAVVPLHERAPSRRAQALVEHGLSLVPLKPRSKEPSIRQWSERQQKPATLRRLWAELEEAGDEAGLAIVCGRVSGVVACDFDDEAAVAWARANLPETPWRTKTTRGEHWFYRQPENFAAPTSLPWKGELRADGQYVVAPGSLHPGGERYLALGDWTAPKSALPTFDVRWLVDNAALRAARAKILCE